MGDKIAIFQGGRLIQYDIPEAILTCPVNEYVADFVGSDRTLKVLGLLKVGEAMNKDGKHIIRSSENTREALKFLEDNEFNSIIVVRESKPLGYVKAESLIKEDTKIGNIVEPFPSIIKEDDTLRDLLSCMLVNDVEYFPVMDGQGNLAGTVCYHDIKKYILDIYNREGMEI